MDQKLKSKWLKRKNKQQSSQDAADVRKRIFLDTFAECGKVRDAAKVTGVTPGTVRNWCRRDEQFTKEYDKAKQIAADVLEEEAHRRAVDGVDDPVYYKGEKVGTVKKYSDTLLIFLLKGLKPEVYRERYEVKSDIPSESAYSQQLRNLSIEELKALAKLTKAEKEVQSEPPGYPH